MKISENVIPSLIDAVKITLKEQLAAYEQEDSDQDELYDPNDLILFDWFVLPVLEDALATGLDSNDMDHKGFGLMIGVIPWYLNTRSGAIRKSVYGELAKIYYRFMLEDTLRDLSSSDVEHLWENIGRINRDLKFALLIEDKSQQD